MRTLKSLFWGLLFAGFTQAAIAASPVNIDASNVAIHGYDPVAYFTDSAPIKGVAEYSVEHNDATYHFVSAQNKETFAANPEKYTPQYGGYCAYAASNGIKVDIDPEAFDVHEGKLYLNYTKKVQSIWGKNKSEYIAEANENWPKIKFDKVK